ncbi:MAG: hypothetical protein JW757_01065 [Anaerolineales bacterium]|nr:hypothetical protein [Anaerolineales bacterium]
MPEKQHYLYQFLPADRPDLARNPDAWTKADNQIAADHFNYLKQALEDSILIFAGRSLDGIGPAVVVFEAGSQKEARSFMRADPFIKHSLFSAELHLFRAALVREP